MVWHVSLVLIIGFENLKHSLKAGKVYILGKGRPKMWNAQLKKVAFLTEEIIQIAITNQSDSPHRLPPNRLSQLEFETIELYLGSSVAAHNFTSDKVIFNYFIRVINSQTGGYLPLDKVMFLCCGLYAHSILFHCMVLDFMTFQT